jgi:CheY-like chemotaxis protein
VTRTTWLGHLAEQAAANVLARRRHRADAPERNPDETNGMTCPRFPASGPAARDDFSSRLERPVRLLLVDDDARVRAAIGQTIASEAGLEMVAVAADAATALTLAACIAPSVALVDVLIPDEAAGLTLVRSLSQKPGCAVVAMSVRGGLRRAALAAGAVAFVEKGAGIDAVLEAVRAAGPSTRHAYVITPRSTASPAGSGSGP